MFWRSSSAGCSSSRRSRSTGNSIVDRCGLVQLTKWCTLFIILECTSGGNGLITTHSTATALIDRASSSSSSSSSSATISRHLAGAVTVQPEQAPEAPRYAALIQDTAQFTSATSSRGKTLPLLGSGALKETLAPGAQLTDNGSSHGEAARWDGTAKRYGNKGPTALRGTTSSSISSKTSSSNISSGTGIAAVEGNVSDRAGTSVSEHSELATTNNITTTTTTTATTSTMTRDTKHPTIDSGPAVEGSSFSKIVSANLILAEVGLGSPKTGGTGQKLPTGFSGSSSSSGKIGLKAAPRGATSPMELEVPGSINKLDGIDGGAGADGNFSKMYFETDNHTVIASQVGSIAVLPCAVRNIGEGVEWPLQIKYVQLRDAGLYECQVSTHPPTSIFVKLDVVEAKAEIFGPSEKYLKPGSMLRLTCRVVQSNEPPLYIFWYHNNRMINYDAHRGVNVSTEADNRYSELFIAHTNTLNSGNYSCVSNNAVAASTLVHILNGENPAAMQHGDHGNAVLVVSHIHLPLTIVTYQVINFVLNMH
uniref:Ig-like domain-containing protein n=1 Tax=Anopheles albimanus TaxID=7167 RepID=A0A182F522_ANOAL